jgi:hypothetical protein
MGHMIKKLDFKWPTSTVLDFWFKGEMAQKQSKTQVTAYEKAFLT